MAEQRAGEVTVEVRLSLDEFRRMMSAAERETRRFDQSSRQSFGGVRRSLTVLSTGARRAQDAILSLRGALFGLSGVFVARKVLQEFAAFERGLIGVGKTTGIAGAELQALGRGVQDIASETPVATVELLGIAQAAGQLGVKGNADILRFTETVGKLGLASNLSGDQAAAALARILTVTGTSISQVDRLGSTIVQLGNNFAATESEIAGVTTRVAQSTAQFAVTASEATGIAAALRSIGVQAEAGGTVIGRAFQKINDAVRQGGEELENFTKITGLSAKELREQFFEAPTAAFQSFVNGLGRINDRGGDVAAALSSVGLEGVRVIQTMGTLAARSSVLGDALRQANDEWQRNTALNEEALVAAQSFSAQMTLTSNAINEAATAIGRGAAPEIVRLTEDLREFLRTAEETGQIEAIAENVGNAIRFLADNMDHLVTASAAFLGMRLGAAFGPWGAAIGLAAGLVLRFSGSLTTATDSIDTHIDALDLLNERLRGVDGSNEKAAEGARKTARANLEAAKAALQRADAELQLLQALSDPRFPADDPDISRRILDQKLQMRELQGSILQSSLELAALDKRTELAATAERAGRDGGGGTTGGGDSPDLSDTTSSTTSQFENATQAIKEHTAALRTDLSVINESVGAQEAARAALELKNAAARDEIALTPQRRAEIERLSEAYGDAVQALHDQQEALQNAQEGAQLFGDAVFDALDGIVKNGENALQVIAKLILQLIEAEAKARFISAITPGTQNDPRGPLSQIGTALGMASGRLVSSSVPLFHSGGVAGTHGGRRSVPVEAFARPQILHSGGTAGLRSDEVPSILRKGEPVFASMNHARAAMGGGQTNVVLKVINNNNSQVSARQGRDESGAPSIEIVLDAVDNGIKGGRFDNALGGRFGNRVRTQGVG